MSVLQTPISLSHRPELDKMTPAMIRVVAEFLLYTMQTEQRITFIDTLPGIYKIIYPDSTPV